MLILFFLFWTNFSLLIPKLLDDLVDEQKIETEYPIMEINGGRTCIICVEQEAVNSKL